ncbi:MAG TPA: lipocalin-like domain-containing protein [Amycolatopsis sp.]|nr:lipocalin-like domain-containing protein [Amycolatopsis sp.]
MWQRASPVAERLVGVWQLVSMTTTGPDGPAEPMWQQPVGTLVYTPGRMATIIGRADLPRIDPAGDVAVEDALAFVRGFIAYYGEWVLDEGRGAVIHRVRYSSYAPLLGADQVRFYHFEAEHLTLRPQKAAGERYAELTWRKVTDGW